MFPVTGIPAPTSRVPSPCSVHASRSAPALPQTPKHTPATGLSRGECPTWSPFRLIPTKSLPQMLLNCHLTKSDFFTYLPVLPTPYSALLTSWHYYHWIHHSRSVYGLPAVLPPLELTPH